jgi:oxygen-independent coproporphyrinogen-3 oxidase
LPIFFGGGTPSVHSRAELEMIFNALKKYFIFSDDIEISLEANPGTIDKAKFIEFQELGINRISIGAQTFDPELLIKLGRGHSVEDTYRTLEYLSGSGFRSWSFDLIYGLPGQTIESWTKTLDIAMSYKPPHISAYALSIEAATPYGAIYKNSAHQDLPPEDDVIAMYELTQQTLTGHGLKRYEISNWAQEAHEARHNLTYWYADEYYAFGLSAHGYVNSVRYANTKDLGEYIAMMNGQRSMVNGVINAMLTSSSQLISDAEKLEERIMLNLRLDSGLLLTDEINQRINTDKLNSHINSGFIEKLDGRIKLSDKAIMLSNKIIADLLL